VIAIKDLLIASVITLLRCNLKCKWCFESASPQQKDILSKKDIKFILNKLKKTGVKYINFTGGEPFIRNDFIGILHNAVKLFKHINITTNGLLIDVCREKLDFYRKNNIHFGISIEGPLEFHENIRGRGIFNNTLDKINILRKNNIYVNIQVTLSKKNYKHIPYLIKLAKDLKVNRISFMRVRPFGRGKYYRKLTLSSGENYKVARYLFERNKKEKGLKIMYKDPLVNTLNQKLILFSKENKTQNKNSNIICGGCRAGVESLFIHHDGNVFPCPFLQISLGNILRDSIKKIWLESPLLEQLRDKNKYRKCKNCKFWEICRGCRAEALSSGNGLMGRDPGCWN